jgi:hypothetical protein
MIIFEKKIFKRSRHNLRYPGKYNHHWIAEFFENLLIKAEKNGRHCSANKKKL